jgi:hypothetical protein
VDDIIIVGKDPDEHEKRELGWFHDASWDGLKWLVVNDDQGLVVSLNHNRLAVNVVIELVAGEDHCQKFFFDLRVSRLRLGQCARRVCHGILLLEASGP